MKKKLKNVLSEYSTIFKIASIINFTAKDIKNALRLLISIIFRIIPIKNNKIVICNYFGKGYGDNGKYITEEIIKQNLKYDIVWLLNKEMTDSSIPSEIRTVNYNSIKGLYELATAKIWIDNSRKNFYPIKRKNQFYIQTWHGGISMKKIEKDAETSLSYYYINLAKKDSEMADLFISNSKFCTDMYRRAFWYTGKIMEKGSPRCDILLNNKIDKEEVVKDYFNIDKNNSILLYAPTFREDSNMDAYNIEFNKLILSLEDKFGGEWKVLVRLHPNISGQDDFMKYDNNIINATNYPDMYELMAASDILITDYSSTMFEFSISGKPVFLYATDIADYKEDRNFNFNIEELPYKKAEDNKELIKIMKNFNNENYLKKIKKFYLEVGLNETGIASKKVVEEIKKQINNHRC